jgi:hypothetical protein
MELSRLGQNDFSPESPPGSLALVNSSKPQHYRASAASIIAAVSRQPNSTTNDPKRGP